jgi:hypothetical protein
MKIYIKLIIDKYPANIQHIKNILIADRVRSVGSIFGNINFLENVDYS